MKKAFSLLELLIVITLLGIMTVLSLSYFNTSTIAKEHIKTQFQSHLQIITTLVLQCKELSADMPSDAGVDASDTLVRTLRCDTSTPYTLDDGTHGFIPQPINGFSDFKATESGDEFYISTEANKNTTNEDVLNDLNSVYSTNQYTLTSDATKIYLKFYISK
ncbi:MAG: prepilin-type N-terminal cleavage/methylation domain-containing protein [Campylobacterales bacterium]|nr:prepilin-type N-terminal cleavage/methylation domain-containing protein [Campylobacterales bacterium]